MYLFDAPTCFTALSGKIIPILIQCTRGIIFEYLLVKTSFGTIKFNFANVHVELTFCGTNQIYYIPGTYLFAKSFIGMSSRA